MRTCHWVLAVGSLLASGGARAQSRIPEPPVFRGVVDLTIDGQVGGEPGFTRINSVGLDEHRRIYVADAGPNRIDVFDSDGRFGFSFGRRGSGPGDLKEPCCLTISSNGLMWVYESGNRRFSAFRLTGRRAVFQSIVRLPDGHSFPASRVSWDGSARFVAMVSSDSRPGGYRGTIRSFFDSTSRIVRQDSLPSSSSDQIPEATAVFGRNSVGIGQPFGPSLLRAFGPNAEFAIALSSRYAITRYNDRGRQVGLLVRELVGPRLTSMEKDTAEARLARFARDSKAQGATVSIPFGVPERKPPIAGMGFDLDGRLWVLLTVPVGSPREADVWNQKGKRIARMSWPADVSLPGLTVRGNVGIGVREDSLGVQRVVRLRFRR